VKGSTITISGSPRTVNSYSVWWWEVR